MRWKVPLFVFVLIMTAVLHPFTLAASGSVIDEALDFTLDSADPMYPGDSGDGWSWDAATKVLTLSGINVEVGLKEEKFAIQLPDGAEVVLAAGTDNSIANSYGSAIFCPDGSLAITGAGNLGLSANAHGIRAYHNLTINMTGNLEIYATGIGYQEDDWTYYQSMGLRVGYGSSGDLVIRNCSNLTIVNDGDHGIRCDGDVEISDCGEVAISADSHGIRCFGGVIISNCGNVSISADFAGIRSDGSISIGGCNKVNISGGAEGYSAIRNNGDFTVSGCSQVLVTGYYNGIRCDGDVLIANCPDIEAKALYKYEGENGEGSESPYGHGIYTTDGGVTILKSKLKVYGASYGIATGPVCESGGEGGDIIINESYVSASCDRAGFAAIYAGDAFYYGEEGEHAKIVLTGCSITTPANCRIVNVKILEFCCQSFTALAGIEYITDWEQAAKAVTIEPPPVVTSFTVSFDSRGGSAITPLQVFSEGAIAAPPAPIRSGYTFGGWYKDAEYKNAWNFDTDKITGDVTLYAKWIPVAKELPPTSGWSTASMASVPALCLLGGLLMLAIKRREYA